MWKRGVSSLWYSITYLSVLAKRNLVSFTKTSNPGKEPDKFRRKKCRGDKSSHLHGCGSGGIMAMGSFPIPTRLGRAARSAGRLLFMPFLFMPLRPGGRYVRPLEKDRGGPWEDTAGAPSIEQNSRPPCRAAGCLGTDSRDAAQRRLRPPPRLPSMLRFKSAIFPSEEERNCLSLSSKD